MRRIQANPNQLVHFFFLTIPGIGPLDSRKSWSGPSRNKETAHSDWRTFLKLQPTTDTGNGPTHSSDKPERIPAFLGMFYSLRSLPLTLIWIFSLFSLKYQTFSSLYQWVGGLVWENCKKNFLIIAKEINWL